MSNNEQPSLPCISNHRGTTRATTTTKSSSTVKTILFAATTFMLILGMTTTSSGLLLNTTSFPQFAYAQEQQQAQSMQHIQINSGPPPTTINFQLPEGYTIQPVLWNLSLPTSVTFDENGTMYLAEAGYAYGGLSPQPRILKVASNGTISILLDRMLNGPVNDIEYHEGKLYISHRGVISTLDPVTSGLPEDIIVGLPSNGDHHNNQIAFGPDGRLYFGQGTATNSGVVGIDNFRFGWPQQDPWFHDTPGMNITLTGNANSMTPNPLTPMPNDTTITGGFVPFGNRTEEGQKVQGDVKCNGCIISANPDGTDLRIEAWGLRNPFGAAFSPADGRLLVSMNGADERGSRPVANDTDKIYNIDVSQEAKFYGWPDFFGNAEPATLERFQSPRANVTIGNATAGLQFIMQDHPQEIIKPLAQVQVAAALTQVDFSNSSEFGHEGMAFIAEFGSMIPATHAPEEIEVPVGTIGHKVIMVDLQTGNYSDFLSTKHHAHLFRPVGVEFNDEEGALYVVSIAKMEVRTTLPNGTPLPHPVPWPYENTGIVWKIIRSDNNNNADAVAALSP